MTSAREGSLDDSTASEAANTTSLTVQLKEQRITVPLTNAEHTTAAEVMQELSQGPLKEELDGKQIRLIFSGRVLGVQEVISRVVPAGAVVLCAVVGDRNVDVESQSNERETANNRFMGILDTLRRRAETQPNTLPGPTAAPRRAANASSSVDYIWGFILGYFVGPLMFFWLLEPAPLGQKIGIVMGCAMGMFKNYQKLSDDLNSLEQPGEGSNMLPANSFEIYQVPPAGAEAGSS